MASQNQNSLGVPAQSFCGADCLTEAPRIRAQMPGQPCGNRVLLQCFLSRAMILAPGKGRPRGGAAAVPEEPPPSRVRSDLQASLTGWGFYPIKATFESAHWASLVYGPIQRYRGSRALFASSCPASKGAEPKATGSEAKRGG